MGYKEKQVEWLKMNGLREGSRVYVYRKAENYEDGWRYWWIDCLMDEEVGKVANIMEIHPCSLKVKVGDKTFYMPYTALLPVGVTEFEVGRRYKYVGPKSAEYFIYLNIEPRDATLVTSGAELMVEKFENDRVKFTTTNHSWHFKGNWNDFVAIPEKDYYKELDRWITTNDLKVGDKVRILPTWKEDLMKEYEIKIDSRVNWESYPIGYTRYLESELLKARLKAEPYDRLMSGIGKMSMQEWANFLGAPVTLDRDGNVKAHYSSPVRYSEEEGWWYNPHNQRFEIPRHLVDTYGCWPHLSIKYPDRREELCLNTH